MTDLQLRILIKKETKREKRQWQKNNLKKPYFPLFKHAPAMYFLDFIK